MKNHWLYQEVNLEIHTHNMTTEEVSVFLDMPVKIFANKSDSLLAPDDFVCGPILPKHLIGGYPVKCRRNMDTVYLSGSRYNFRAFVNNGQAIFVPYAERSHSSK
jgi:hypothetical protein